MSAEIRATLPGDREAVIQLLQQAGLPTDDVSDDLVSTFLSARDSLEGSIVGLVGVQPFGNFGLLRSLVVQPKLRGQGLGLRLLLAAEQSARNVGVSELWLLTIDADTFFTSHGYSTHGREDAPNAIQATREFSELCPDDAILMKKRLL